MGRPKLNPVVKQERLIKRLLEQVTEVKGFIKIDPEGPVNQGKAGRPPVPYKTQLERIQNKLSAAKSELEKLKELEGLKPTINLQKIKKLDDPSSGSGVGRPAKMEVQDLEYKIRQKEQRIERIKEGQEKERLANLKTKSGKQLGRYPKSDEEKIQRLKDQIKAMQQEVVELEKLMTPIELEELKIRRMRRLAANLRTELRAKGIDELRFDVHDNWESARDSYPFDVIECVALERAILEKVEKLEYKKQQEQ